MLTKSKWDNISSDIETFEESFFTSIPSDNNIDVNSKLFKTAFLDLPWMTREAKLIKCQKHRAHTKACRTKSERDWARFRLLRKTLRQLMKRSCMDYINNLIDPLKMKVTRNYGGILNPRNRTMLESLHLSRMAI